MTIFANIGEQDCAEIEIMEFEGHKTHLICKFLEYSSERKGDGKTTRKSGCAAQGQREVKV